MSIKSCCYKDCGNYNVNNVPNGSFTLFQFPKDPVRRKQWMELGQVDPDTVPNALLMCSDHFDRSKYMSVNPRRTVLVGAAVPFPYCSKIDAEETSVDGVESTQHVVDATDTDADPHNTSFMYFEEDHVDPDVPESMPETDEDLEDQYPVEFSIEDDGTDNIITYKEVSIDMVDNCSDSEDIGNVVVNKNDNTEGFKQVFRISPNDGYKVYEKPTRKRKILEVSHVPTDARELRENNKPRPPISNSQTSPKFIVKNISVHNDANGNSMELGQRMDPEHVTTFIYHGEEYVRMSKEYYLREKSTFLQKIKKYETVLKTIKQNVNILDLS